MRMSEVYGKMLKKEKVSMELLNKKLKTLLVVSLISTVCLPLGIVGIVFGAVKGIGVLLGFGIAFTVFGFYGMPILWVRYGAHKGMGRLIVAVEQDNLYKTEEIASMLNITYKEADARIREALVKRYLTGYVYEQGELQLNTNVKKTEDYKVAECKSCGAKVILDPRKKVNVCEYCGSVYEKGASEAKK